MRRISKWVWMLGLMSPVWAVNAGQVALTGLSYSPQQAERLVFDLSDKVHHRYFVLDNPSRLVIDFQNTRLQQALSLPGNHPLFANVRSSVRNTTDLRVVVELKNPAEVKAAINGEGKLNQLQVDLLSKPAVVAKATTAIVNPTGLKEKSAVTEPVKAVAVSALTPKSKPIVPVALPVHSAKGKGRDIVVAIDAGHGGKDVGAQGSNGTQEKDVVFAIAKRLEAYVNGQQGMRALMIRKGDYFVKLHERVNIARAAKADLLVSIHADAFNDSSAHGASVYTLSKKGASSAAARWLADSENASDLIGGVSLDKKDDTLASVLMDLSQTAAKDASSNVGSKVLKNVKSVGHLHREAVQKAGFVVLKAPDIPSILVETAFISNPNEEQRLNTGAYQDKMAAAVFRGIYAHFRQYAPANTLMAQLSRTGKAQQLAKLDKVKPEVEESPSVLAQAEVDANISQLESVKSQHKINQGETLSGIAQQYGVSMRALRVANRMDDGAVKVGQVLQIPRNS